MGLRTASGKVCVSSVCDRANTPDKFHTVIAFFEKRLEMSPLRHGNAAAQKPPASVTTQGPHHMGPFEFNRSLLVTKDNKQ